MVVNSTAGSRSIHHHCAIAVAAIFTLICAEPGLADRDIPRESLPISWQKDADLTDVFFLNRNQGWAVGAQGVVLRTVNGGKDWLEISQVQTKTVEELPLDEKLRNLQSGKSTRWTGIANGRESQFEPLRCRFESVHFVDERHGWIAGGYDVPYVNKSRAVVMRTSDGGVSWQPVDGLVIPRINRIFFSDAANGWAIGETGNLFRTGIYFSSDGGHTWSSQSSGEMKDWIDGEKAGNSFINLDSSGQPGLIRNNRYEASVLIGNVTSRLTSVLMIDAKHGWAVGDNGTILQTENGGLSWSQPISAAKNTMFRNFDFSCVRVSAGKIWIGGNPGTMVFSIDLKSGEMYAHRTGMRRPIHNIHFVDDQIGWMVGALGTIVATTDGGQTWQVQHGKHQSVALLGVATQESELPLEAMALLAGEENRVCGAVILMDSISSTVSESARQAIERLGCSTLVSLPRGSDDKPDQIEKLVRTIRTLRPNVIVCNSKLRLSGSSRSLDPESLLVEAIHAAADPLAFPGQLEQAALNTWQVDRLAIRDASGKVSIDPRRMLPRTGSTVEDRIAISRALLNLPQSGRDSSAYRVRNFTVPNGGRESDLFGGLVQSGRQIPTRQTADGFRSNLSSIKLATSKQEKIEKLARFEINSAQDFSVWHQQVLSWTLSLDSDVAGIWLFQLAERYLQIGKTELAAHTLEVMTTRFSAHAFSSAALTWLTQHYTSNEMGLIAFRKQRSQANARLASQTDDANSNAYRARAIPTTVNGVTQLSWSAVEPRPQEDKKIPDPSGVEAATHTAETDEQAVGKDDEKNAEATKMYFQARYQRATQFLSRLGQQDPDLVAGSQYRLIEAQLKTKLTGLGSAEGMLKQLAKSQDPVANVSTGAQRELVLGGLLPTAAEDVVSVTCFRTSERPRLDGNLDDIVWQQARDNGCFRQFSRNTGDTNVHDQPDQAAFACDNEFLYAAFRCYKLKGQYYQAANQPRPRDPDLSRRDRIEFAFDVDRDYRSAQHFIVDHRGWVAERCGGAQGWNPKWFVSQTEDEQSWTVELAIPLNEIVASPIDPGSVWALQLARRTYDSSNLWATENGRSAPESRGLQVGFLSQPAQYELMQFK